MPFMSLFQIWTCTAISANQKSAFHFIPQDLENVTTHLKRQVYVQYLENCLTTEGQVWHIFDILKPQTSKTLRSSKGKIRITLFRFLLCMIGLQINFKSPASNMSELDWKRKRKLIYWFSHVS